MLEPKVSPDAYTPSEMARRVEDVGVTKANLPTPQLLALSLLAGAFIAMGAALSTVAQAGGPTYGATKLLGGLAFSLGLVLVVIAGAELFTGNNLLIMAWASGKVKTRSLLRSWILAYLGNFAGAVLTALLIYQTRTWGDDPVGVVTLRIAATKTSLGFIQALCAGVLCNALVCLAVWLCFSARSTTDRVLCIVFPITAFVALSFEHSIANMYFIPMGMLLRGHEGLVQTAGLSTQQLAALSPGGLLRNLVPVTLGNLLGGGGIVAGLYWFIYLRQSPDRASVAS